MEQNVKNVKKDKKVKLKPIDKTMVIHCPKEENLKCVLDYINENLYKGMYSFDSMPFYYNVNGEDTCVLISCSDFGRWYFTIDNIMSFKNYEITEFSDMVIPDVEEDSKSDSKNDEGLNKIKNIVEKSDVQSKQVKNEKIESNGTPVSTTNAFCMTTVDVLEWLSKYKDNSLVLKAAFTKDYTVLNVNDILELYEPQEIIDKIEKYEQRFQNEKAVLVFDKMPKYCRECDMCVKENNPLSSTDSNIYYCPYYFPWAMINRFDYENNEKPDWCPLQFESEYLKSVNGKTTKIEK